MGEYLIKQYYNIIYIETRRFLAYSSSIMVVVMSYMKRDHGGRLKIYYYPHNEPDSSSKNIWMHLLIIPGEQK